MSTINERLIELRNTLKLSQDSFGERISLVRSGISNMEKGIRNVSDRTIKMICQEFNVNEEWLRTGNGSMFKESDLEMLELLGERINSLTDFQINAIKELIRLTPEQIEAIATIIKKLAK